VYWCAQCQDFVYSSHSCGNRHCPTCGGDQADAWRDAPLKKLLPVPYFLVTFTLPHFLNAIARSHQHVIYDLLFKTSADALHTLALNPDWLGGTIGMVGVFHTWDRAMGYHVHVHSLVPAGGLDPETGEWIPSHPKFLVPASALREVFWAKFRDALHAADPALFAQVPPKTWSTAWVVHCKAVGDGRTALKYLAPYVARVALSNRRLVALEEGQVTFRYKPSKNPSSKNPWTTMTLDVMRFMQRFLQHVLPKGFQKIRSTGFLHPNARTTFTALQAQLAAEAASECLPEALAATFGLEVGSDAPDDDPPDKTNTTAYDCLTTTGSERLHFSAHRPRLPIARKSPPRGQITRRSRP
jgi:hypothetical protein